MGDRKKASFDEKLLDSKINPVNQQYVDEYVSNCASEKKRKSTIEQYLIVYDKVFRFKENWDVDFKDYNNEIYMKFQLMMFDLKFSTDRIDFYTSSIK